MIRASIACAISINNHQFWERSTISPASFSRIGRRIAVVRRDLARAAGRLRHASLSAIPLELARAIALHWRDGPARLMVPRPERIVVSLTTVPERADRILPALRSLLDQTCPADRIVLAWPYLSRRTGLPYPQPPNLPFGVELLSCDDEGPASKLLPTLRAEPDAVIIVVDDDVIYPSDFIANLLAAHRANPCAALGWRGWQLNQGGDPRDFKHVFATGVAVLTPVDVLFGTWGHLIPPHAFDPAVHDLNSAPQEMRWVDDVWISGHLARRGIDRFVVPARTFPIETRAAFVAALTDTVNRSGHNDAVAIDAFRADW